jgi:predicted nucleic acid-binding protein
MEPALLGVIIDTSVLVAGERAGVDPEKIISELKSITGDVPMIISLFSVAELAHGIYRARDEPTRTGRRDFLDRLKAAFTLQPPTEQTAEIVGRVGGEHAARGDNLPVSDLWIAATALELGYGVVTGNAKDFMRIAGLPVIRA